MIPAKLELLIDLGPQPDKKIVENVLNELRSQDQVKEAIFKDGAVMVETTLPSSTVVDLVQKTSGKRTVLQGFGEQQSAVAMISSQSCCGRQVMGVVRFQQCPDGPLLGDGSVDGLTPGQHGIHVRTAGDLSQGCESLGAHYNPRGTTHGGPADPPECRHAGDLGNICADETGRATFRILDSVLKIDDIIGRSVSISERADDLGRGNCEASRVDGNSGKSVACGVIARSAGVFQNPKRICLCDGVVVWDERDRPLAGRGRSQCCGGGNKDNAANSKPCCKV